MADSVDLDEFDDQPGAKDYPRANGAPMVSSGNGDGKRLRYSRPSGWGHDLDDESNLVLWKIDRAMDGVASSPALAAKIVAAGKTGRKELREEAINKGRGEEASDMGTALHAMTVKVETEDGWAAPEPFDRDLAAYLACLGNAGLKSAYIEVPMVNDQMRAAGTCDRIFEATRELLCPDGSRIAPGTLIIGDIKTGGKLDYSYPGYTIQLALYAGGVIYDLDTETRKGAPDKLHTQWGLLVHLPAGTGVCELLWVDLEEGREGARIVQAVRKWRKMKWDDKAFTMPDEDIVNLLSQELGAEVEVDRRLDVPEGLDQDWVDAMAAWAQLRVNAIGRHSEARALLLRKWPDNIPPLKVGGHTSAMITEILNVLDMVETAFSMPWPEGDPRVVPGVNKAEIDLKAIKANTQTKGTKETKQP